MIVIDQDPALVIPNICERYIKHKAIIVDLCGRSRGREYTGVVLKFHTGNQILYLKGGENNIDTFGEWYPTGKTLIDLLCNIWDGYKIDFDIKIFVLSNSQELTEVSQRYDITNRHVLEAANRIIQSNHLSPE